MAPDELRAYHRNWKQRWRDNLTDEERAQLNAKNRARRKTPEQLARERKRSYERFHALTGDALEQRRAYHRRYALDYYHNRNAEKFALWRAFRDWLKAAPCVDCGGTFPPCVMDFDHRDPAAKRIQVTKLLFTTLDGYQAELVKCDLVCANCHRIRTHLLGRGSRRGKRKAAA